MCFVSIIVKCLLGLHPLLAVDVISPPDAVLAEWQCHGELLCVVYIQGVFPTWNPALVKSSALQRKYGAIWDTFRETLKWSLVPDSESAHISLEEE
jgi:hypothetical protein